MPERCEARAPTRIDLAGGTVDLWPLCLLHDRAMTVNAAINLYARAQVTRAGSQGITIRSLDRGAALSFGSVEDLIARLPGAPPDLEFPMRLAAHFLAPRGSGGPSVPPGAIPACEVTTECAAPAGSGLGGSSTLGIALAAALDRFVSGNRTPERLLFVTRSLETQVLRVPTGEQDYHPALHGGVLALHYTVEGTEVERLEVDLGALGRRVLLVDTRQSRSSGLSNWDMLKRYLDGDQGVRAALEEVNRAAGAMRDALVAGDWHAAGAALGREWEARKRLSPSVSSPAIDRLIDAAREAGATAGKVCGAGGGGCLVLWVDEDRRDAVRHRVETSGGRVLPTSFVSRGVQVTES